MLVGIFIMPNESLLHDLATAFLITKENGVGSYVMDQVQAMQ